MFKLAGGGCMVKDPLEKARAKPTMRVQMKTFWQSCGDIAKYTMRLEDAEIWKPSTSQEPRLRCLAILTHKAMIKVKITIKPGGSCLPCIAVPVPESMKSKGCLRGSGPKQDDPSNQARLCPKKSLEQINQTYGEWNMWARRWRTRARKRR